MAGYDGSIRINTEINTSNLSSQMMRVIESIRRLESQAERLRARLQELSTTQIPTQAYKDIESDIARTNRELDKMLEKRAQMQNEGKDSGDSWERLNQRIQASRDYIEQAEIELQELVNTGRAFRLGSDTEEFQRVSEQLRHTEAELDINNRRLEEMQQRQSRIPNGFNDMRESAHRATQSIDSDISRVSKRVNSLLRILSSSFGLTLGIVGLVRLGKEAVETASDVLEIQNVVDVAFGKMSYKIENFADSAIKNFGLSRLSAKKMGSTFMSMGAAMINSMEDASDMAVTLTGRAADMASYFNTKISETETALQSIYTGETKSLKRYGVVMTEVNLQEYAYRQGINKKISAMTQQEKVMLRYNYVLEKTALAEGDFVRTQDNWANQIRILKEQFKELLSILGSGLITVLNPVVKFLNTVLSMLIAIAKQIGAILSKLFGISIPVADSGKLAEDLSMAAGGADDLAEGVEAAGKAAKGALAPFDKLNVLSKNEGGGKGGAGAGGSFEMPDLEMDETQVEEVDAMSSAIDSLLERLKPLFDWFVKLKDLFVEGFFDGLGESWKERIDEIAADARNIVKTLTEIFTDPGVVASARTMIEKIAYALGQVVGSLVSIGITIAQNIVGGIDMYLEQNKEFLKQKLISIFDITGDIALLIGEAFKTFAYIFEAFGSESGQQLTANIIGIFNNTLLSLLELGLKFKRDMLNIIIQPFADNKEAFRAALEGFLGVFAEVTGTIKEGLDETFAKINEIYDENFKPMFDSIANGLSEITGKFLEFWNGTVQPILEEWAARFDALWKSHIQPLLNKAMELFDSVANLIKALWENILKPFVEWIVSNVLPAVLPIFSAIYNTAVNVIGAIIDIFSGLIDYFKGVIDFLTGVFSADWEMVFTGISEMVSGKMEIVQGIVELVISAMGGIVTEGLARIRAVFEIVFEAIKSIVDTVFGYIGDFASTFMGSLENGISNGLNNIKNTWSNIFNGIKDIVVNIFDSILGTITGAIDKIKGAINSIYGLWAEGSATHVSSGGVHGGGGGSFSARNFSESEMMFKMNAPRLADGAVIRGGNPFMAVLGDQPKGQTNIEAPLATIRQAVREEFKPQRNTGNETYVFQVDGKTFFEVTRKEAQQYFKRTGMSPYPI